jgi:hypothetical protein
MKGSRRGKRRPNVVVGGPNAACEIRFAESENESLPRPEVSVALCITSIPDAAQQPALRFCSWAHFPERPLESGCPSDRRHRTLPNLGNSFRKNQVSSGGVGNLSYPRRAEAGR